MAEYQQPFVEDASDDSDNGVNLSRMSPSQSQANVAAKRSNPSDSGVDKTPVLEKVVSNNIDARSDSGYSSFTAATMNSADSAPSAMAQSPPAPVSAVPIPPPSLVAKTKRRSTIVDSPPVQSSPRKPLGRTHSVSRTSTRPPRERRPTAPKEECRDPNCNTCGPNARGRRPEASPLDSALDISYPPFDTQSQRSDPAPLYSTPRSPTYTRQQPPYIQGSALVQPAVTRTRRSSSTRARPVSYHGTPGQDYYVPGMPVGYPSPPQEHGPPLAMSAYHPAMHQPPQPHPTAMAPYAMMGATPPNNYFPPGHPMHPSMHTTPPFDAQRPPMPTRNSSNFSTRRPLSNYGPALIKQDHKNSSMPSARYAPRTARQDRFPQSQFESDSSEEESSEDETDYSNGRAIMAPPPPLPLPPAPPKAKAPREPRPALPHAHTTQVYPSERRMSQSLVLERPRPRDRESKLSRVSTVPPSRSASISRPAVRHSKAESARETSRVPPKIVVEDPRALRRQSLQREYVVERPRSKVYREEPAPRPVQRRRPTDDSDEEEYPVEDRRRSKVYRDESPGVYRDDPPKVYREEPLVKQTQRRRHTDADNRGQDDYIGQTKLRDATNDVEAYMQRTRGSNMPFNDQVHKAAKRASIVPPDARSSRSKGSDERSQSNRTTMTNGGGEIRLRVDASAPLSLSFNGDMEGRTLHINPTEDGMAELVIANPRGNENTYRSERGSVLGISRKSIAPNPRREAEETRSTRSGRSVRDGERRVLRRKADIYE